jgi:anti-sigma-K factor RskA
MRRRADWAAALATVALSLVVAAVVARPPPDFAALPVAAVLRDAQGRAVWQIRLAASAHKIAAEALRREAPPAGRAFELWLKSPEAAPPLPLGLLPLAGKQVLPVTPLAARRLSGSGELFVTVEPAEGAPDSRPHPPILERGRLGAG